VPSDDHHATTTTLDHLRMTPEPPLSTLRCPHCRTAFDYQDRPSRHLPGRQFGLLDCGRHTYPVIDGIPVIRHGRVPVQDHTTGTVEAPGPTVDYLVGHVRGGDGLKALVSLLAFAPELPWPLPRVPVVRDLLTAGPAKAIGLRVRHRTVRRMLAVNPNDQTAQDWMELFYLRSHGIEREQFAYFFHRFAQPRTLAALALIGALPADDPRPVLDLACGFGHLAHAMGHPVVGTDRNYFQLWTARHWVAPGNFYVCADAADPLPFADDTFAAALCADAFHLLPDKQFVIDELRRCAPDGPTVIARAGNSLVEPNEGSELSPKQYVDLLGDTPYLLFGDQELIDGYLTNSVPMGTTDGDAMRATKWVTVVAGEVAMPRPRPDGGWPHASGTLAVNPVYTRIPREKGEYLLFGFPTPWYAFENHTMLDYHVPALTVDTTTMREVSTGQHTPAVEELVRRFAVIGLPRRYARNG
jgi:SAM-dependent methyltransferase/uncharacterized protein YbaR (Trm112 family)